MKEWAYAQANPSDELAQLYFFSVKKRQPAGNVEFIITVREFADPPGGESMRFVAQADKQTNQKTAPFTPSGWGSTLMKALADCIRAIHQFPYEGPL